MVAHQLHRAFRLESRGGRATGIAVTHHGGLNIGALLLAAALCMVFAGCAGGDGWDAPESGASDDGEWAGRQERGRDPGKHNHGRYRTWDDDAGTRPYDGATNTASWYYALDYRDAILSPDGKHVLALVPAPGPDKGWSKPAMVLTVHEIATGKQRVFPDLVDLRRINFSPDGKTAWALSKGGGEIAEIDLVGWTSTWRFNLTFAYSVLDVTPDGKYLVASNVPLRAGEKASTSAQCFGTSNGNFGDRCRIATIRLSDELVGERHLTMPVRDIDFMAETGEILISQRQDWNETRLLFVRPEFMAAAGYAPEKGSVVVPNCVDELVIVAGGKRALLSPNDCVDPGTITRENPQGDVYDPISVIDLVQRKFDKNLPGFGPVAVTPDGKTAVGFTRRQVLIDDWNYTKQTTDFGLIIVELATLKWTILDWGDQDPQYTISPDGKYLLAHDRVAAGPATDFRALRLDTGGAMKVVGPTSLGSFAWSDKGNLWIASGGSLWTGTPAGKLTEMPLETVLLGKSVQFVNIRPQGDYVLAGRRSEPLLYLVSTTTTGSAPIKLSTDGEHIKTSNYALP